MNTSDTRKREDIHLRLTKWETPLPVRSLNVLRPEPDRSERDGIMGFMNLRPNEFPYVQISQDWIDIDTGEDKVWSCIEDLSAGRDANLYMCISQKRRDVVRKDPYDYNSKSKYSGPRSCV